MQGESFPSVGGTQANGICGHAGKDSPKFQPKETTRRLISGSVDPCVEAALIEKACLNWVFGQWGRGLFLFGILFTLT